jgi:quercetin dioxygenase-like cupin family protein
MSSSAQQQSTGRVSERTPRSLSGEALSFDLGTEAELLKREQAWHDHGHNARTLAKYADFRVVMVVLKTDARMRQAQSDQCMTVQPLSGSIRVYLPDSWHDVGEGQLLTVGSCVPHEIVAVEESAFLLCLGWSKQPAPVCSVP